MMYIVKLGNEVVGRHICREKDKLKLVASNGTYEVPEAEDVEIQGRVILSGQSRRQ